MSKHRYLHHLEKFASSVLKAEKSFKKNPKIHPGILLYQLDGRTPFFQLQGLARIDNAIGKHQKYSEKWFLEFKNIEDAFGKMDFWLAALDSNKKWKFNAELTGFMQQQAWIQLGVLESRLEEYGWVVRTSTGFEFSIAPMERFKSEFKKCDWYTPKKEKKKIIKFLINEAEEIEEKLASKEIDLNLVEEGIHEFRRKLRWLGIYSSALNGKVYIDKHNNTMPLDSFVTPQNKSLGFNKLPVNKEESDLIGFLPGGFYAMSDLIKSIGDIKDPALYSEEMMRLGAMHLVPAKEIKKRLGMDFMNHHDAVSQAKDLIEKFVFEHKLIHHISEHFKKQI
jgi:hypothetical protein